MSWPASTVPWSWSQEPETLAVTEWAGRFGMGLVHLGEEPLYEPFADDGYLMPALSPDSTHFAYLKGSGGHMDLWIRSIDGSVTEQISTDSAGDNMEPVWLESGELFWRSGNRFF